jgi:hypothetical protein
MKREFDEHGAVLARSVVSVETCVRLHEAIE